MDILGIGMPELIFIILIALIILGPKDMEKTGRAIGRWLNKLVKSEGWQAFRQTSREVRNLPTRLMREANLEEIEHIVKDTAQTAKTTIEEAEQEVKSGFGTWGHPAARAHQSKPKPTEAEENRIAPSELDSAPPATEDNDA